MPSIFNQEGESVFETEATLSTVEPDKLNLSLDLIARNEDVVPQSEYLKAISEPIEVGSTITATEQKGLEDQVLMDEAHQAIGAGDVQKTDVALAKIEESSKTPASQEHFTRGVFSNMGISPTWNTDADKEIAPELKAVQDNISKAQVDTGLKSSYIAAKLQKIREEEDDTTWANQTLDFLGTMLDFGNYFKAGDVLSADNNSTFESTETTSRNVYNKIYDPNISFQDSIKYIDALFENAKNESGLVSRNRKNELLVLNNANNPYADDSNQWMVFDLATSGLASTALKGIETLKPLSKGIYTETLKRLNPSKFAKINANASQAFKVGEETAESNLFESALHTYHETLPQELSSSAKTNPSFGRMVEAYNNLTPGMQKALELSKMQVLNEEEITRARLGFDKEINKKDVTIMDSGIMPESPFTNTQKYYAIIGNALGQGFGSLEGAAEYAAKELQIPKNSYELVSNNQGIFIKHSKIIDPLKYTGKLDLSNAMDVGRVGGEYIRSASNYLSNSDEYLRAIQKRGLTKAVIQPEAEAIQKLKKTDRDYLNTAFLHNQDEDAWFDSRNELIKFFNERGWEFKPKHWEAYQAAVKLNDFDWFLKNRDVYDHLVTKGYETVDLSGTQLADHFGTPQVTARFMTPEGAVDQAVFDLDSGQLIPKGYILNFDKDAYDMFTIATSDKSLIKKFGSKHFRVKKNTLARSTLQMEQLGYSPGGRRVYSDTAYLVQQGSKMVDENGIKTLFKPTTHTMSNDVRMVNEYVEKMNKVRGYYKKYKATGDSAQFIKSYEKLAISKTPEEMIKLFDDGVFDADEAFEIFRKSDRPVNAAYYGSESLDDSVQDMIDTGSLYFSKRGNHLTDIHGSKLKTIDAVTALDRSVGSAVNNSTVMSYGVRAKRQWVNTFVRDKDLLKGKTLDEVYNSAIENLPTLTQKEARAAKVTRDAINRYLGRTNSFDKGVGAVIEDVGYTLHEKYPNIPLGMFTGSLKSTNPISFFRAMAFHQTLGLFSPHNFVVQTTQALTIAGSAGVTKAFPLLSRAIYLQYHGASSAKAIRNALTNSIAEATGAKTHELERFVQAWNESGFNVIADSVSYLEHSPTGLIGSNMAKKAAGQVLDWGRLPFDISERFNRATAFSRAWDELKFGDLLRPLKESEHIKLADMANKYSLDMISNRASYFQKGILAATTQFYTYPVRLLEAILPKAIGGSAKWTGKEKSAMVLSMLALYGSNAFPMGGLYEETVSTLFPGEQNKSMKQFFDKGLLDAIIYYSTDGDAQTELGRRVGFRQNLEDFYNKAFSDDSSMSELILGASLGVPAPLVKGYIASAWMAAKGNVEPAFMYATNVTADNITTLRNARRAANAIKDGMVKNRYGNNIYPVNETEAYLTFLGIPAEAQYIAQDLYNEVKTVKEATNEDQIKYISHYVDQFFDEKDKSKANRYLATAKVLLEESGLPESVKDSIVSRTLNRSDYWTKSQWEYYDTFGELPPEVIEINAKFNKRK